ALPDRSSGTAWQLAWVAVTPLLWGVRRPLRFEPESWPAALSTSAVWLSQCGRRANRRGATQRSAALRSGQAPPGARRERPPLRTGSAEMWVPVLVLVLEQALQGPRAAPPPP